MFQRGISAQTVHAVLDNPQLVAAYEDDKPYPSQLLFAVVDQQALHVLVATTDAGEIVIITVYRPDPLLWTTDFLRKKP